ncbi:DUF6461 domain-containing protein [Streptosporangium sp. NPDC006930]|uniref:DUF6461 domain-containing protein n=1 Tax=unclassified Streptosporangium TaxID=2632669 RepID=UPI003439E766
MSTEFDFYKRTIRSLFNEPVCVTWTKGADTGFIARQFGGDEEGVSEGEFNDVFEAYEMDLDEGVVLISPAGEWTLAVEATRYLGIKRSSLESLSRSGEALSLAWNGEAQFGYAVNGRLSRQFDPFNQGAAHAEPEYLHWASGYGVTVEDWQENWLAAAFTVAERISGVRIDQSWKERSHLILRIGDASEDEQVPDRPDLILKEQMWETASRHPRIAVIAADPSPERMNEVSLITAELAVGAAGLEGPLIDRALGAIGQGFWGAPVKEIYDELAVMAADFLAAASVALEDGVDVLMPPMNTAWGRLYIKHYAVKSLMATVGLEGHFGLSPSLEYAKLATASRRRLGDTYDLLCMLQAIDFYVANGENAISG